MRQRVPLDTDNKHPKRWKTYINKAQENDLIFVSFEECQAVYSIACLQILVYITDGAATNELL